MAVIFLPKPSENINNCLTVVGLPPTGPSVAPNYTISFPNCLVSDEETARITGVFDSNLDDRLDNNYFCCNPIDGGSA